MSATQSAALDVSGLRVEVQPHLWSQRRRILDGVDLRVGRGEIFGFLGPNGSGKTTTIKAVLGLIRPAAGSIRVLDSSAGDPAVRRRLGFMPEQAHYPDDLTARELVLQHALLAGARWRAAQRRTDEVLERMGMTAAKNRRLATYSKGMLQRVGLAQALVGEPDLVILDEPMSGLDPMGRRDVREILLELRAAGKTVFFSTHILPDVEMICDRVAILVAGRVRRVGELETLLGSQDAVDQIDVVADGCDAATARAAEASGARCVRQGDTSHFAVHRYEQANQLVDLLRGAGARIRSVSPQRRSLEDVFVDELRGDEPHPREEAT